MRTDGRTGMKMLIVAFRNFANAPNKDKLFLYVYTDVLFHGLYVI